MKILLRGDGNDIIGYGHVYRLLALADILKDKFEIVFAICAPSAQLAQTVKNYCAELIELPLFEHYTLPAFKKNNEEVPFDIADYLSGIDIVVLDGYWFGPLYQQAVKNTGVKLVCIDDFAENYFFADAVINHAPGLDSAKYKGEPYTKYFLGLDYALLRKDFFRPFTNKRTGRSLFLNLGGTDTYDLTPKLLESAMRSSLFNTIYFLAPVAYTSEHLHRMEKIANETNKQLVTKSNMQAAALVELMDSCDYALVSASTILLECYSRRITCFTGYYTSNQLNIYNGFIGEKRAIGLGDLRAIETTGFDQDGSLFNLTEEINKPANPLNAPYNLNHLFTQLIL
ncbi:MAG TPA: hypothetical protein VK174_12700 [Chitinophagales bacterium]|nr:hypothetical protein [Chitinophagales bacterium]